MPNSRVMSAANHPMMFQSSDTAPHDSLPSHSAGLKSSDGKSGPPSLARYQQLYAEFNWAIPEYFNIAEVCCRRWAEKPQRVALYLEDENGVGCSLSYGELAAQVNQLSAGLQRLGVERGDRVALLCPPCAATAIIHLATYQLGAIALPISPQLNDTTFATLLERTSPRILFIHQCALQDFQVFSNQHSDVLRNLAHRITIDCEDATSLRWCDLLARSTKFFKPITTRANDPALLFMTHDREGQIQACLLPHRALIGHLPGFVASQNWFPKAHDCFWTSHDWSSANGLLNGLLPTLYFGMPLVGYRGYLSPTRVWQLLETHGVSNVLVSDHILNDLTQTIPPKINLRAIACTGHPTEPLYSWVQQSFGIPLNSLYGHTESNNVLGQSGYIWPICPGSLGLPLPGQNVQLVDEKGQAVSPGMVGEIAVQRQASTFNPNPTGFLAYWQDAEATRQVLIGPEQNLLRTGDLAVQDANGYFWYRGPANENRKLKNAKPRKV